MLFTPARGRKVRASNSCLSQDVSGEELTELRAGFKEGQVLGDDFFLQKLKEKRASQTKNNISLKSISQAVCCVCKIDEQEILSLKKERKASFARGVLATVANSSGDFSIEEIAIAVKRDGSTVSSLLSRFSMRHKDAVEVQQLIEQVRIKAEEIAELQV